MKSCNNGCSGNVLIAADLAGAETGATTIRNFIICDRIGQEEITVNETTVNLAGSFKFNAGMFNKTVEGIAPESWFVRPGSKSNHLLWVAGHVVLSRKMVLQMLGLGCPRPWEKLFARGASPVDAEQYPKPAEILAAWAEVSGKLDTALDGVSPQILSQPAPPQIPSFDGRMSGAIAFFSAHESYHIGQMAYLRKWLGYSQAVG